MTGTALVLVIVLILARLLVNLVQLVIASVLARRNGLQLIKVSWSSVHGITAEYERR
jgi:hypothetical protein